MRTMWIAGLSLVALAACGGAGSDRDRLVQSCLADDGGTQEQCNCLADAAVESLEPELVGLLADAAESEEGGAELMEDLSPEDGMALMGFVMSVGNRCNLDMS